MRILPLHRLAAACVGRSRRCSPRRAARTAGRGGRRPAARPSRPPLRCAGRAAPASRRCSRPRRRSPGLLPARRRRSGCRRSRARSAWPRRAGTSPSPAASRRRGCVNSGSSRLSTLRHELNVEVDGRHFDFGIAAEHDDAGPVALLVLALLADRRVDVADHRRAAGFGNAQRLIEQVDDREPVARPLDTASRPARPRSAATTSVRNAERHQPPPAAQPAQAAEAEPPHRRQQQPAAADTRGC